MMNWVQNLRLTHEADKMVATAHYLLVKNGFEYETAPQTVPFYLFTYHHPCIMSIN